MCVCCKFPCVRTWRVSLPIGNVCTLPRLNDNSYIQYYCSTAVYHKLCCVEGWYIVTQNSNIDVCVSSSKYGIIVWAAIFWPYCTHIISIPSEVADFWIDEKLGDKFFLSTPQKSFKFFSPHRCAALVRAKCLSGAWSKLFILFGSFA